jgi:glucan biosynthesis protein C
VGAIALAVVIGWAEAMWPPAGRFVCTIAAIAATQALVSLARTFLDRPNPTVRRLVDGSFVIYLFHLPILIGLYDLAKLWSLPPAIGFPSILASTMGLSWFVWRLVERSTALNFLFNGIVPDARVAGSRPHVAGQRPAPSL